MADIMKMLADHPFTAGMEKDILEEIAACAQVVKFEADEYVIKEGGSADHFYLFQSGRVALESHSPGKPPLIIETLSEGDILGWSWLIPPYKWAFDARVVRLTRAIAVNAKQLRAKMDKNPQLGYLIMQKVLPVVGHRLALARLQMLDLYAPPAARK